MYMQGDLFARAMLNFDRLEEEQYQPDRIFQPSAYSWPGDYEGRTILALALLAQSTHREPKYLAEIVRRLPGHLNEQGYMGPVYPAGVFDEQQLASHSWLLRGLIAYYRWRKEERVYRHIEDIVNRLLLPLRGHAGSYPSGAEERGPESGVGAESGSLRDRVGNWYLSTDIGCLFIMLDGASDAYELTRDERIRELLEEMLDVFFSLPLLDISAQTHATLSALRGALRYGAASGDDRYTAPIERTFRLYTEHGMTENHANYNWFNKPFWTEPCAIIDSYIVAFELWKTTGKSNYWEEAQQIYYNAMCFAQRYNGGFGCDTCAGAEDVYFGVREKAFEAHWCCTMRGGEGLSRAIEYAYMREGETLLVTAYHDSVARIAYPDGTVVLRQSANFPLRGDVRLEVVKADLAEQRPRPLRFPIPSWCESVQVRVNGQPVSPVIAGGWLELEVELAEGSSVDLRMDIPLRQIPTRNRHSVRDHGTFRHGFLILGERVCEDADGNLCAHTYAGEDAGTGKGGSVSGDRGEGAGNRGGSGAVDAKDTSGERDAGSAASMGAELQPQHLSNGKYRMASGARLEPLYRPAPMLDSDQRRLKYAMLFRLEGANGR